MHNWLNVTHSIQTIWSTQLKNHYTVIMIVDYGDHRDWLCAQSDSSLNCSIGRRPSLLLFVFSGCFVFCPAAHGDSVSHIFGCCVRVSVCVCISYAFSASRSFMTFVCWLIALSCNAVWCLHLLHISMCIALCMYLYLCCQWARDFLNCVPTTTNMHCYIHCIPSTQWKVINN